MIRGWRWGHLLFELSACQMCCCPVESLSMCVQCSRCGSYASHMEACWGTSEHGQGEIPARAGLWTQTAGRPVTRRREESNDLHSQTNTVAHLHNNKAGAGGELGTPWNSRTEYFPYTDMKSTRFPFSFFNYVSCRIKRKNQQSFLPLCIFLSLFFILASHGSIISVLLI